MRMSIKIITVSMAAAIILMSGGCAKESTPGRTVVEFLSAIKSSNAANIQKSLSFEKLLQEKMAVEGVVYQDLSPEVQKTELENFKKNMTEGFMSGKSKALGDIDPKITNERISGNTAEVTIINRKNQIAVYRFTLIKEGGDWKIHRIEAA